MRIVFFTDTYHPGTDGVVRSIDMFEQGLLRGGNSLHICAPHAPGAADDSIRLTHAPSLPFPPYPQYRIPLWASKTVEAARQFEPDIIHCHAMVRMGLAAREAAEQTNAPLIGTFHTLVPHASHYIMPIPHLRGWTSRRLWDYFRWFYSPFDRLLAPSRFLQQKLAEEDLHADVLPNPVDTEFFKPTKTKKISGAIKSAFSFSPRRPSVLFLGRLAHEKNIDFLLDMAGRPSWKKWGAQLVIAGDGPYRSKLQARVKKEGLSRNVTFLGRVPEAQLPAIYSSAHCTVQPSAFETQGLTALESMACGTPAAVRAGTALSEVVKPSFGGEWFYDDSDEAIEVVRKLCESRSRYSSRARSIALQYSVEKCTNSLVKIYKHEINKKKK